MKEKLKNIAKNNQVLLYSTENYIQYPMMGFPGGAVVENPPASAEDMGSSPGLGRSHTLQSN